jgi:hypothetical protein
MTTQQYISNSILKTYCHVLYFVTNRDGNGGYFNTFKTANSNLFIKETDKTENLYSTIFSLIYYDNLFIIHTSHCKIKLLSREWNYVQDIF